MYQRTLAAILFLAFALPSFSQKLFTESSLFGNWHAAAQHPSGATIETLVTLKQDLSFTMSSQVNGNPLMEASGAWKLNGKQLVWTYQKSSHPAIQAGFTDTDEVQVVAADTLVLKSLQSGKTHHYKRTQ